MKHSRWMAFARNALWVAALSWAAATSGFAEERPPLNRLKATLAAGKVAIGPILQLPSAPVAALLAQSGFDWVWIDMEHGPITIETAHAMIQATTGTQATPIVRIPWNQAWLAKPALDVGAFGIVTPVVNTRAEAAAAVAAVRYPPEGVRGFGPVFAASRWGLSIGEYAKVANREVMAIVQIEDIEAVRNIDEILTVPGIDLLVIGPFDLSGSMGKLGQVTHPEVEAAIARVLAAAKKAGVPAGILATTPDDIRRRIGEGFQFIAVGVDSLMLTGAARNLLGQIQR